MAAPPLAPLAAVLLSIGAVLLVAPPAAAEVVGIDVSRRDDFGSHERVIARVRYAVDPRLPANRRIADLAAAPTGADGRVEFSGDLLMFVPKRAAAARGTVFLEAVNRGRDQSLALMSAARQASLAPEHWNLGDRFLLQQGFTVAFLGWQFDVEPGNGLALRVPIAPVTGVVRASAVVVDPLGPTGRIGLRYCARMESAQPDATLTFRTIIDGAPSVVPRPEWTFAPDGCTVTSQNGFAAGLHEVIYRAAGSPIAGLGLAAVRDFASYLKHGPPGATLREDPSLLRRVIGFGYSQSGRFLRELVRDGFNADEDGRAALDGLFVAAAGAGGGSFNHRFAAPGDAGNSVLSILRPVDLPPFTDDGLLADAMATQVVPRVFYTFSSTEYWARAGSLTHTHESGSDAPLAPTSRLYFLTGTPHASGALPPLPRQTRHALNFAEQRWTLRALLVALDDWISADVEPPPSRYPTIAGRQLVPRDAVRFPRIPSLPFPDYMPQVWRMDFGADYAAARVITKEPPTLGRPYTVLVPQVNADGNDEGGIPLAEVAAPLGTHTGWNVSTFPLAGLGYLAGLAGSFQPFALTRAEREQSGDSRRSIEERYAGRDDYLQQVRRAASDLIRQRFLLPADADSVVERAALTWDTVVAHERRPTSVLP